MRRSTTWTEGLSRLRRTVVLLLVFGAMLSAGPTARVRVGADRILEEPYVSWLRDKDVALITNQTGVNSRLESLIDILRGTREVRLKKVFAPEHGLEGELQDGEPVADSPTAVSLYPEGMTVDRLEDVDLLLYDIQDVGVRFYTFISTLLNAMKTAGAAGIPIIVLDRPNPLGGLRIDGPVLEEGLKSFVGAHSIPVRYGLTAGELARLYQRELKLEVDLRIVPLDGWERRYRYQQTGLEWISPSPNMPTLATVEVYGGMAWIEGTNLSEGRGTTRPFEMVGAPWLDNTELVERLNQRHLAGVRWRAQSFTPMFSKYSGERCRGVQLHVLDPARFSAPLAAIVLLEEVLRLHPEELQFREQHFDRLVGNNRVRTELTAGTPAETIVRRWRRALDDFRSRRRPALLYR